jgi:hypothetical protein
MLTARPLKSIGVPPFSRLSTFVRELYVNSWLSDIEDLAMVFNMPVVGSTTIMCVSDELPKFNPSMRTGSAVPVGTTCNVCVGETTPIPENWASTEFVLQRIKMKRR